MDQVVLYGNGSLARRILLYNSVYQLLDIVGIIDDAKREAVGDIPIYTFSEFEKLYTPLNSPRILITIGYAKCNSIKENIYNKLNQAGYKFANFISPKANSWADLSENRNLIILDDVFVGPGCIIGNCVVICPGTVLAHDVQVEDFCFFSNAVVVGGSAVIGKNTFLGLNSTIKSSTKVGKYNIVASAANVVKDSADKSVLRGNPAIAYAKDTLNIKI